MDDALVEIFYRALEENSQGCADTIMGGMFLYQLFTRIPKRMEQVVKTNRAWGQRDRAATKSSCAMNVSSEQAKIIEEIMQQLAQLHTSMDFLVKQSHERVHAVVHQPPKAPIYKEYYFDRDACFVSNQVMGFRNNAQRSNSDYWHQGFENQG